MHGEVTCSGCHSIPRNFLKKTDHEPLLAVTISPPRGECRCHQVCRVLTAVCIPFLSPYWQVLITVFTVHRAGRVEEARQDPCGRLDPCLLWLHCPLWQSTLHGVSAHPGPTTLYHSLLMKQQQLLQKPLGAQANPETHQ